MKLGLLIALFTVLPSLLVYAQEDPNDDRHCLPEIHAAVPCHCLDMGGYQLCTKDGKAFSYDDWAKENKRRETDIDPKTKKQKQPDIPMCKMSCKEQQCDCCDYMKKFQERRKHGQLWWFDHSVTERSYDTI